MQNHLILDHANEAMIGLKMERRKEYQKLLKAEKSFYAQRAKFKWVSYGDTNTQFFHSQVKLRQSLNWISSLSDGYGTVHTEQDIIDNILINYYKGLLGTEQGVIGLDPLVINTGAKLNVEDYLSLTK